MEETKSLENHWTAAYTKTPTEKLGWYEAKSKPSLEIIKKLNLDKSAHILNVGAGSTTLIDDLVKESYTNITANDISQNALDNIKERLGTAAQQVQFIVDDLTNPKLLKNIEAVDLWNDRAVLHFFTEQKDINTYFQLLKDKLKVNAYVIFAEFSLTGAKKCCGLNVKQYDENQLQKELGEDFKLIEKFDYEYTNPNGDPRPYIYTLFKRMK